MRQFRFSVRMPVHVELQRLDHAGDVLDRGFLRPSKLEPRVFAEGRVQFPVAADPAAGTLFGRQSDSDRATDVGSSRAHLGRDRIAADARDQVNA